MSSAVVSTSAAPGRPFVLDVPDSNVGTARREQLLQSTINHQKIPPSSITPASQLEIRPSPEMVSSGIPAIDTLTGGLPRGCLTEICGPASSGRTTLLLAALAAATRRGEFCVLVDASDTLDPQSAAAAGVELERLLWVRCGEDSPDPTNANQKGRSKPAFNFDRGGVRENGSRQSEHRLEQVLRATDLLLESGGFGLIILDLGDLPPQSARRIPLTTWFRFRRAVEHKPTILLAIEQQPIAGSCSSLQLQLGSQNHLEEASPERESWVAAENRTGACLEPAQRVEGKGSDALQVANPSHAQLLTGLHIHAEIRSRLERKPACAVRFATKTAWAG